MARSKYYHDPARKHLEQYQDFSGGRNVMSSNENIKDNELVMIENADLGDRGSLKRRKGYKAQENVNAEGKAQMLSRFHRNYTPYNLLGVEGAFDGVKQVAGETVSIGSWYNFNMSNTENAYKEARGQSAELVTNGDFENGETGWIMDASDLTGADSVIGASAFSYSGGNVMRISFDSALWDIVNEYQQGATDTKEGEEFYVEAMYHRSAYSVGDPAYRVHIVASIHKEDGSVERKYMNGYDVKEEWQQISGYFRMPKDTTHVAFGLGVYNPNDNDGDVSAYFDNFYARREIAGSENSVVGIRAAQEDTSRLRGMGSKFTGLKSNAYYIYLVDYKSDGEGTGRLAVRDERFGVYPQDNGLILGKNLNTSPTGWTTQFMKFKTYDGMEQGRAYVYNHSPLGSLATVYYDNARIYEVKSDIYEQLDSMTTSDIASMFPFRTGKLTSETISETVTAIGGKFFVNGEERKVENDYPVQSDRIMEAVAYAGSLYIASGSGLFVYNGSTIAKVNPYIPDPLETLYIGTNGLEETPFSVADEEQSAVSLKKVQFSRRYGVTNEFITINIGVGKPGSTSLEYKFERRNANDKKDKWFTIRDWDTDNSATFITDIAGEYQFKISVRETGTTLTLDTYTIPKYIIKPTEDEGDIPIDSNTINLCNRILLHWDRLIMYGDQAKQDVIYISDLQNPNYFPVNNTLRFENPRKERITTIKRYRDNLVVFTPSSIQALYGTNPEDFKRVMLNTDVGCIADRAASVMKNYIIFPSYEGITLLKTVGTSETRSNVEFIDANIRSLVEFTDDAVAYVRDNQYCIAYPSSKKQLRLYFEWGAWVTDTSPSLDFTDVVVEDGDLFILGSDGRLIENADNYADEGVAFEEKIGTKHFLFGEPYAIKKTKELQIMLDELSQDTTIDVEVSLDTGTIATETINLTTAEDIYKMIIAGKGLSVRVDVTHAEDKQLKLVGFGFIFKLKNP